MKGEGVIFPGCVGDYEFVLQPEDCHSIDMITCLILLVFTKEEVGQWGK